MIKTDAILRCFTEKTGISVSGTSQARAFIREREKEGYTAADMEMVIQSKTEDWKGTKDEKYLRLQTLLSKKNFARYLEEARQKKAQRDARDWTQGGRFYKGKDGEICENNEMLTDEELAEKDRLLRRLKASIGIPDYPEIPEITKRKKEGRWTL